jgi:hypothetical protein
MNDGALLLFSVVLSRLRTVKQCERVSEIHWVRFYTVSQDPSNNDEDEQEQFTARRIQGLESGSGWVFYDYTWCSNYSHGIFCLISCRQVFLDLKELHTVFLCKVLLSIWLSLLIYTYSYGWCRTLLTSITSKMVRLHLLYALLIHFCYWGAWAQVRTSSTKCCAPSEENVHSLWSFYKFLETQEINNERYYRSW